ncbi:monopolin complex subunit Mam1p [Monosporozyma servazzii]
MRTIDLKGNKVNKLPLSNKNVNINQDKRKHSNKSNLKSHISQRQLLNKSSLKREGGSYPYLEGREAQSKKVTTPNYKRKIERDEKTEIKVNKLTTHSLSKGNLRLLQEEIGILETKTEICEHFLCSNSNMKTVDFSRLWFLFELEMSVDGIINLRNDCYHEKVYKTLDAEWPTSNCLKDELPSKLIPMKLSQIILPKPLNITHFKSNEEESLSNISLFVESILENDSHVENKKRKMIPTNKLATRDKRDVFENIIIDVKTILSDRTSSSILLEQTFPAVKSQDDGKSKDKYGKLSYFRS